MSVATMPEPSVLAPRTSRDATPQQIISAARSAPATAIAATVVASFGSLLMWASFTPVDAGPLAWLCLVPLIALVRIERATRAMYRSAWVAGLVFWIPALQWMRLGDPTMYGAWILLSLYMAAYFPLFVGLSRVAVHRLHVPLIVAVPLVWTGLELARSYAMSGFGWYLLGHSQYRWTELIQIADVTGVYGISFVLALAGACLCAILPDALLARVGLLPPSPAHPAVRKTPSALVPAIVCAAVFGLVLGYGYWRRSHANFAPGPRVAAVRSDFIASARVRRDAGQVFTTYNALTGLAVREQPDLIVWPEGAFPAPLLETKGAGDEALSQKHPHLDIPGMRKQDVPKMLQDISQRAAAAVVFGLSAVEVDPDKYAVYNSAQFVTPDGLGGRYDKIHRVIFGEYIPLVDVLPFLRALTPYSGTFGIAAGKAGSAFVYKGIRYSPVICYEDTVPQLVRSIATGSRDPKTGEPRRIDVLLNLSDDGWFHGSSEHDQHLITAAFRCVELRTPMVRAANMGISAVIDGDGVIRAVAVDDNPKSKTFRQTKGGNAVLVRDVPLDRRTSLYMAYGDWFGGVCLIVTLICGGVGVIGWWKSRRA